MLNIKKTEIKLMKKSTFVIVLVTIATMFIIMPINVRAQQTSITIYADYTLTGDIIFDPGHGFIIGADGITLDGNGYNISGDGGSGVLCGSRTYVTIKNLTVDGFHDGISVHGGHDNSITGNFIVDNTIGIMISSSNNYVTNNIIKLNDWGVLVNSSDNYIYRNLLINNVNQIWDMLLLDPFSQNYWYDSTDEIGNFWSNYFGLDDGSGSGKHAIAGDDIGDTELPHESVDEYPLLDPSIPEIYGPLPYADWWMWGRGGSSADVSLIAPNGDEVSEFVNTIGINADWAPNPDYDPGEAHAMVMVSLNPYDPNPEYEGEWTLQLTAVGGTLHSGFLAVSWEGNKDIITEIEAELDDQDTLSGGIVFKSWAEPGGSADVGKGDTEQRDFGAPTIHVSQPMPSQQIDSSSVYVEGTVKDDISEPTLKINDVTVTLTDTPDEPDPLNMTFSTLVDLDWGENEIKIEATDGLNSITVWRTVYRMDLSAPIVIVTYPVDSQHIYSDSVVVEGIATDNVDVESLTVNDDTVTLISTGNPNDPIEVSFSKSVNLEWGENVIIIEATDGVNLITVWTAVIRAFTPLITSIDGPVYPIAINTDFGISGNFIDSSTGDTHSATWDWDDGKTPTEGIVDQDEHIVTGSYNYDEPGVYSVTLTVEDSTGESDTFTWSQYIVIYNPSGYFVTGGGWIDSPLNAYQADPDLTGKANFGFVAKYKKGSNEPTGNTEFQFRAADLNFHSDNYEWLVIAGSRAIFKGSGTINGEGSYKFLITAIDGAITNDGTDKFRIKIWEEVNGAENIIYDNKQESAISGGSITIHIKGK